MERLIENLLENKRILAGASAACLLVIASAVVFFNQVSPTLKNDNLRLRKTSFEKLDGWSSDNQLLALGAFKKSCARIVNKKEDSPFGVGDFSGNSKDWQSICTSLSEKNIESDDDARKFIEANFIPYEAWGKNGKDGLFTGYYEPTLHGSLTKHDEYKYPIYMRPETLIDADLGMFSEELKGKRIVGRVEGSQFVPYYNREQIEKGALAEKSLEMVWVDNPIDNFFLHIQGSGRVELDDGEVLRVGYMAQNGHQYTAIGAKLIAMDAVKKEDMSMQAIRKWLEVNPDLASSIMNTNASYIFFRKIDVDGDGPLGAEGISLTPKRSLAVDRKQIPYGMPIWLDAEAPVENRDAITDDKNIPHIRQLMVAQDTGGAIKGAVRGDFFWGAGEEASHNAGIMKSSGKFWLLVPKSVEIRKDKLKKGILLW